MADLLRRPESATPSSSGCFLGGCGNRDSGGATDNEWLVQTAVPAVRLSRHHQRLPDTVPLDADGTVDLAKEMNELSFQEREKVLDDIHGVAPVPVENPEEIKACLKSMDEVIASLAKPKRRALDRAIFLRPSLQNDDAFKLMFLRADQYDARKAARRLIQYFEFKQELFGVEKVAKDLTLDDLDENAKGFLNFVGGIVLPKTDPSGRPTVVFNMTKFDLEYPTSMLQCFWYQVMGMLEDEAVQMKGICVISTCFGNVMTLPSSMSAITTLMARGGNMVSSLPVRVMSDHFCYNDARLEYIVSAIRTTFEKSIRLRIRAHFGSPIEVQYSLLTFGIDCSDLLGNRSTDDGFDEMRRQLQRDYIAKRRDIERQAADRRATLESSSGIIVDPRPHDVLVGRGRPYQEYCGNLSLNRRIDDYMDRFNKLTDRFDKTVIFTQVVRHIQQDLNGRFIERTSTGWTVVNDLVARNKTASGFRFKVKSLLGVGCGRGRDNGGGGGDHSSNSEEGRSAKRQRSGDIDVHK